MLILKLAYNEDFSFYTKLSTLRDELKKKNILIGLVESIEGKTHIIKIICEDEDYNDKIKELVNMYVSNILYRIVIDNYKKKEMFEFITGNYFFLKQSEIIEIEELADKILKVEETSDKDDNIYCLNRINSIVNKINACISENQEINIDGFITFRMRKLTREIEQIIDKVIEMYTVEKEYGEFVKLLKYFVDMQESKIDEINIIFNKEESFDIEDKNGNSLYKEFLKELTGDENTSDINCEDIIISGLITTSPKTIIIHNKEYCKSKEFLETLDNVFGERVCYNNEDICLDTKKYDSIKK